MFYTYVAGTMYVEGIEELEPHLKIGDKLTFFREPNNPYDAKAIRIENADGVKIGYVPRADNVVFARLMDAGKRQQDLMKLYGISGFPAQKAMETARRLPERFCARAVELCLEADEKLKTSYDTPDRVLEMLVLELAGESRNG